MENEDDRYRRDEEKQIYVLKIYRRGKDPGETLVGTIEGIRGEEKGTFKTPEQLIQWIGKRM